MNRFFYSFQPWNSVPKRNNPSTTPSHPPTEETTWDEELATTTTTAAAAAAAAATKSTATSPTVPTMSNYDGYESDLFARCGRDGEATISFQQIDQVKH